MEQEKYPKKIYIDAAIDKDVSNMFDAHLYKWSKDYNEDAFDNIEYIRTDLIPKWHKYPEEKPPLYNDYLITNTGHTICIAHYNIDGWHNPNGGKVIAWQKLPKPFKED